MKKDKAGGLGGFFEGFFQLSKYGTNLRTEVLAGLTTFIAVAYVLILNPQVLSDPYVIAGDTETAARAANGIFIGTCIGACFGTLMVALYARLPFVQAPGMGLNAFFAYTVMVAMGYTYSQALVIVFVSGVFFILITSVGLREAIIRAIPDCVKGAIAPGIGLFITIIGLKNSGLVVGNSATLVSMVDFAQWQVPGADLTAAKGALVALIGLIVIGVLHAKGVKGSILIGIIVGTLVGIPLGVTQLSNISFDIGAKFADFRELSFLQLDFAGLFGGEDFVQNLFAVVMLVISFSLVNMFDSVGTLLGAAKQSGLVDKDGDVVNMKQALMSDAVSTVVGALVGTSTVTTMVESSAGIAEGGRTGLTSLVASGLFLVSIIFLPVVTIVPGAATASALIFVGVMMLSNIREVDFSDMTNALPAFCTVVFMPFTYSIANGIAMGLITFCLIKLLSGQVKEIRPLAAIVAVTFVLRYAFMTLG